MAQNARKKYSVEAAREKGENMFRKVGCDAGWDVDSVEVDDIEEV